MLENIKIINFKMHAGKYSIVHFPRAQQANNAVTKTYGTFLEEWVFPARRKIIS